MNALGFPEISFSTPSASCQSLVVSFEFITEKKQYFLIDVLWPFLHFNKRSWPHLHISFAFTSSRVWQQMKMISFNQTTQPVRPISQKVIYCYKTQRYSVLQNIYTQKFFTLWSIAATNLKVRYCVIDQHKAVLKRVKWKEKVTIF